MVGERYRIEEFLGKGAMGEVYRAYDTKVEQRVALKFLSRDVAASPRRVARVRQEVRLARAVAHPNVCRVYDLGESEVGLFLSMEYLDGEDLASLLTRVGRLAGEKAVDIARQVTAGLAAAHATGVLHRDLKPANIMLDARGRAHITDFGLAVPHDADEARCEIAGTPAYMAPEQASAGIASVQSDLFSLGAVLYELFTGKRPFKAPTLGELVREHREVRPLPPSSVAKDLDPHVEGVIEACLAVDPQARPASALVVLAGLMGGDALEAAVAAGQTPTPQAVAGSAATGALRPVVAWACFAGIALSFGVYVALGAHLSVIEKQAPQFPPQVLAEKARAALEDLGWRGPWNTERGGFTYNRGALPLLTALEPKGPSKRRPAAIVYWHRLSRLPLVPQAGSLRVGPERPPLQPGTALIVLDCQGHLLSLLAVPEGEPAQGPARGADWSTAFRLAGLTPEDVRPAGSWCCPRVFADAALAWEGGGAASGGEIRVRAASLGGRAVSFDVQGPWTGGRPVRLDPAGLSRGQGSLEAVMLVALAFGLGLAWSNLRRKRGDLGGALKLGALSAAADFCYCLLVADHAASFKPEVGVLVQATVEAMYTGGTVWIMYLALEPHVRRLWPKSLVAWSRLLAGHWREPMVARDVLVGLLVTSATSAALVLISVVTGTAGSAPGVITWLLPLMGPRFVTAAVVSSLSQAIYLSLLNLILLLLVRVVVRKAKLAAPVLFLCLAAIIYLWLVQGMEMGGVILGAVALLGVAGWIFLLVRFGLLAIAAALYFQSLAEQIPGATGFSSWYGFCVWVFAISVLALSVYGVVFSVGMARLLPFSMPERD